MQGLQKKISEKFIKEKFNLFEKIDIEIIESKITSAKIKGKVQRD